LAQIADIAYDLSIMARLVSPNQDLGLQKFDKFQTVNMAKDPSQVSL